MNRNPRFNYKPGGTTTKVKPAGTGCQSQLGCLSGFHTARKERMFHNAKLTTKLRSGKLRVGAILERKSKPRARGVRGQYQPRPRRVPHVRTRPKGRPNPPPASLIPAKPSVMKPITSTVDQDGVKPIVFPPFGPM